MMLKLGNQRSSYGSLCISKATDAAVAGLCLHTQGKEVYEGWGNASVPLSSEPGTHGPLSSSKSKKPFRNAKY